MNINIFKRKTEPTSTDDDQIPGDPTTGKKLFCGEHGGYAYWEKAGNFTDGDGRPAVAYECPKCSHIVWDTEAEYRESLC